MNIYTPVLGIMALAALFLGVSIVASIFIGPSRYNRAKYDVYECGIEPTPRAPHAGRFQIRYYLVAMTFIIFDIEVVFMYPWAVGFSTVGIFGLVTMLSFILLITVPYVYEWRRGGLDWI